MNVLDLRDICVFCVFDPRGRPQSRPLVITIFTQSVRPSVPNVQNQVTISALPAGSVGWPSGSLMTPVLFFLLFRFPTFFQYLALLIE